LQAGESYDLKEAKTNQANLALFEGRPDVLSSSSIGLVWLYSKKAKHSQLLYFL